MLTINKSQGQTLSRVGLDLRSNVFAHGQLYVALSHAQNRDSIKFLIPRSRFFDDVPHVANVIYPPFIEAAVGGVQALKPALPPPLYRLRLHRVYRLHQYHRPHHAYQPRRLRTHGYTVPKLATGRAASVHSRVTFSVTRTYTRKLDKTLSSTEMKIALIQNFKCLFQLALVLNTLIPWARHP